MKQFTVLFYERDFTSRVPQPASVEVETYEWDMTGGPRAAFLRAPNDRSWAELAKLLRCPVEIYGPDGRPNWWGYVNRVVAPRGPDLMVGAGLDAMFNYITAEWNTAAGAEGTTTVASDAVSVAEYGRKEYLLRLQYTGETAAQQRRDIELAMRANPRPEFESRGTRDYVQIECLGWYATLDWRYYTNATTSDVEDAAQISAIVTSAGEFLRGTVLENTSGLSSSQERDGHSTALDCINALLDAGTTNIRPLLARVDRDRYLHVYEREAEPADGKAPYVLRDDGQLETDMGTLAAPEHCTCAAWATVQGMSSTLTGLASMRPFFIQRAEYDADTDRCTYNPASAYEQDRLGKYVKAKGGGHSTPGTEVPDVGGAVFLLTQNYASYHWISGGEAHSSRNVSIDQIPEPDVLSTGGACRMTPLAGGHYLIVANARVSMNIGSDPTASLTITPPGGSLVADEREVANTAFLLCVGKYQLAAGGQVTVTLTKDSGHTCAEFNVEIIKISE